MKLPAVMMVVLLTLSLFAAAQERGKMEEWPAYGGNSGGMKYSTLTQINRSNVRQLVAAWKWKTGEQPLPQYGTTPGDFQATPLMIENVLYLSTPYNRVVALNAETGAELWSYDPRAYEWGPGPPGVPYGKHRGVAVWSDGNQRRVFIPARGRLIALNAKTGKPIAGFGNEGEVDLTEALVWGVKDRVHFLNTSPPVIYKDLVIVGSAIPDPVVYKKSPPGDVQAFDARSGKRVWSFHTIPQKGEFGNDTWEENSWQLNGHTNVWAPFVVDEERGLVYLPVSTPANDYYGGERKGANLFADSLVCLDAGTGKRVWHFQTIHHGLWDYDGVSMPTLVKIRADGKAIDAVAAVSKTGFTYVFERTTGKPVWPIEERPVPQSDVPGEKTSPTQPFPTKPPPFAKQGFTPEDVIDFTPELKAQALEKLKNFRFGPVFSPPSMQGTLTMPGSGGGANWGGASFDPETGVLYVKPKNTVRVVTLAKAEPGGFTGPENEIPALVGSQTDLRFADGLPLNKPPYGPLTAIDLNQGEILWQVAVGDVPSIRNHPLVRSLNLPPMGGIGNAGSAVTRGGLVFVSVADTFLYAVDKTDGKVLWQGEVGFPTTGSPMTYQTSSGRQFVVVAAGFGRNAVLVAFSLPQR